MRIRMLAAAVVTAGALMATLTGAASADTPTPVPLPKDGVALRVDCEGGGRISLTTRTLTEAERKELEKGGAALAVPAVPAPPLGETGEAGKAEAGRVTITKDFRAAKPAAEPSALPEDVTVMAVPAVPAEVRESGEAVTLSTAVPVPDGATVTEVRVAQKSSEGDVPTVTCVMKAEEK